jgi:23S rRNA pseudouridine1911/1915/1917 synthase
LQRLDLNVGGVMVFARNKAAASKLSAQIANGEMVKEYVAVVKGTPEDTGTWEDFLFKDSRKNKVFVVKRQRTGVKAARLTYRCVKAGKNSLVRVRLYTGRSHQIRVQFSSRGYPLVGDHKYGSRDEAASPMLFSCCITFPYKGKQMKFESYPEWGRENEV